MKAPALTLIAAVASNGVIGDRGSMPWHLPEDLRHFRSATIGRTVIMGRHTWEALPGRFRPLPERRNIVLSRDASWSPEGAEAAVSLAAALDKLRGAARAYVIGGAEVYAAALPFADELLLTEIERDFAGDTRFPSWPRSGFVETQRERHRAAPPNDFDFSFVRYRRR